ncbi:MAG TPA: class I SAM-dependent methyltransferase [Nocardioides sp.]|uniref:class I SAM-dependent methyltransferase n=1 Tax=Nocardioides sp. TaxID=35761 RepID=UPI002E3691D4|nr:class I SAM-dependent methyltransferase [Nocardioides sp.]HEX3929962.1 class I SAM-dependent methyltransferase [Nocardioides sp.]
MSERSRSFGAVASAYERFRPGYSRELVDEVLAYARGPVRTALEIGAGTGKATRVFAARGIAVTATDPDPEMLAELRRHVPSSVTTVEAAFEDLPLDTTYDLVYAAASLHWTEPTGRWPRAAALLRGGGTFASFGGPYCLADDHVQALEDAARRRFLPEDDRGSPDGTPSEDPMQWPGTELERSGLFTEVRQKVLVRRFTQPASEYVDHLTTVSYYLQLPEPTRSEAFAAILAALPDTVAIEADTILHLARVAEEPIRG